MMSMIMIIIVDKGYFVFTPPEAQRPEHVRLQEGRGGDIDEGPLQFVREEGENLVYRPRQPRRASGVCITAPSGLMTRYKVHVISGEDNPWAQEYSTLLSCIIAQ